MPTAEKEPCTPELPKTPLQADPTNSFDRNNPGVSPAGASFRTSHLHTVRLTCYVL